MPSRWIFGLGLLMVAILAGCNSASTPVPEGQKSFVSGEALSIEGTLAYWPSGATGKIFNLAASSAANHIYEGNIGQNGHFTLTAGAPPGNALSGLGKCEDQLTITPPNPKILWLSFAVSKNGSFAGYAEETEGGTKDEQQGLTKIEYVYNGGLGTWLKGSCKIVITAGAFTQTNRWTYRDVYFYPGWNAVQLYLDTYSRTSNALTEGYTITVALDEVGFSWVFEDFYGQ